MRDPLETSGSSLAPKLSAPQHKPRPLTLFLHMLRSETAGDPARMERALAGLRAYQEAQRQPSPPPMPAIAERRGAKLRDYGGGGPPLLFVPSLINPPNVLDLSEQTSLLRWLTTRGHHVLLLDWGCDSIVRRDLSVAGHVEDIVVPMLRALGEPAGLAGYCLGGTMAAAAAQLAGAKLLATLAAPWRFGGFPDDARSSLATLWKGAQPVAAQLGVLPMEVLQSAFWNLDPARTVGKFEAFAAYPPDSPEARAFVTLEDWANDGPPLPEAAAREMFDGFFAQDLPGSGAWQVEGRIIDPASLPCPQLHVVSRVDRIVPAATAFDSGRRLELDQGHVGMVVGRRAPSLLWEPLGAWLGEHSR